MEQNSTSAGKTFLLSVCKMKMNEERKCNILLCKTASNLTLFQKILPQSFCPLLSCESMSYFLFCIFREQKRLQKRDETLDVRGQTCVLKLMGSPEREVPQAAKGHLLSFCRKFSSTFFYTVVLLSFFLGPAPLWQSLRTIGRMLGQCAGEHTRS